MKSRIEKAVVVGLILSGMPFLSDGDTLKKDVLDHDRINIRTETGEFKGYMKKDCLLDGRINICERTGGQKGWLEKDPLYPELWKFRQPR